MSQQENKKEESKAKNKKDDNIPPKNRPVYDQELSQDQCEKIISIIKSHFIPEEILFRIRPE